MLARSRTRAYSCHWQGTPFSSCSPRTSNARRDPATMSRTVDDGVRTCDGGAGADERRDESVAGSIDFATGEPLQFMTHDRVVVVQKVPPPVVAQYRGALGRADA